MNFTDLFIRKPVVATVVSALILVLGLRSIFNLPVNQYPKTEHAVVTVSTSYYGADSGTVGGFITQPLESSIAQAQGIDYLSSTSVNGNSTIVATLRLNYSANKALTEITTQVNAVKNQLPPAAQQPVITVQMSDNTDAMYMGFYSEVLPTNNITDYLSRVVKPRLDSIPGVQTAEILGARNFALRAWLDPVRMAAHGVTATDVSKAIQNNNVLSALGSTKGQMVTVDLLAATDLHTVEEFRKLAVRQSGGAIVRLEDVATVNLGADDYSFNVSFDGRQSVFLGIKVAPEANILEVAKRVREAFPEIQSQLPAGLTGQIVYDATHFINTSIEEVIKTLVEALLIVTVVIFLFLGTFRAVAVPVIAMPLSLVGTFAVMLALGYTINLLTLLALVLGIGLVVDDAIIVVENADRHMREGKSPLEAAILAARELGGPILAMTVVLVAVYVPIGFQGGLTGSLFTEFAFTLAGAVAVSAVVALTLSPMMCAKFFRAGQDSNRFVRFIDGQFEWFHGHYLRLLRSVLATSAVPAVMGVLILLATGFLFVTSKSELAPQEDQGFILASITGPPNSTVQQMQTYADQVYGSAKAYPEYQAMFQFTNAGSAFAGLILKPWDQRSRSGETVQQAFQGDCAGIAGAQVATFQPPSLPGASGLPVQFVIKTTEPFERLDEVSKAVLNKARASGMFYFVDTDLKIDKPQSTVVLNRDMVTSLGLTQQDVGGALTDALGGNYVNYFAIGGRSYRVIPQVLQVDRLNSDQVLDFHLRTGDGALFPASTVATLKDSVAPQAIRRFQQLNSATISGVYGPNFSQEQVLDFFRKALRDSAPSGYQADYSGVSRQYMQEAGGFVITLGFAVIIVFLALAAQFNSLRDPLIILVSVPMALFGALIFINLGLASLNIYTQVGLVTLMGLISKHGILIVQFANELQASGRSRLEAIAEASAIRLRPILMTTAAMVLGVFPLVIAGGAGAAGRRAMGLVIFTGLSIGTVFTLFVVPAFYNLFASRRRSEG
ncbi:efflux RND transporter permease subunit [Mesoterricola silvestris]|uniref:Acriflavine resistance protein B n=1 Tax=Mesoterricola silvestris TaxID=2927979 RepID=A0AA48GRR2_9BACT|nr:efflux RND transporter permease subunit [Mesoterricola silvestris]BDU74485.1 acriflavine resistance protein B [Mesoterricola silvestris]